MQRFTKLFFQQFASALEMDEKIARSQAVLICAFAIHMQAVLEPECG